MFWQTSTTDLCCGAIIIEKQEQVFLESCYNSSSQLSKKNCFGNVDVGFETPNTLGSIVLAYGIEMDRVRDWPLKVTTTIGLKTKVIEFRPVSLGLLTFH